MKVYVVVLPNKDICGIYGSQVLALQEAHALGAQVILFQVVVEAGKRKKREVK